MSAAEPTPDRDTDDRRRAGAVGAVARTLAGAAGVTLPPGLRLWALAGEGAGPALADVPPPGTGRGPDPGDPAGALGLALEAATGGERRRAHGLHVTPRWLAAHLTGLALDGDATVCDPACGGGAFLLAAAERLHRAGPGRREIVRHRLWGADIDPVGLAAAEAALALWAGEAPPPGRLVVGDPLAAGRRLWPAPPREGFGAVVGNPPFQGQLGRATARSAAQRAALRARFGAALRPYTDTAWLFLLLGCELARPGGRVVLVQPQSLVAARDAGAVRAALAGLADLRALWVDEDPVFAASVRVCAPVLVRRTGDAGGQRAGGADRWRALWADALGVPGLPRLGAATLGERAEVVSGFRDQYYGLAGVVRERRDGDDPATAVPLVTSGAVGWARCTWGDAPVRYAKRSWRAPVVDLARLAGGDASAAARRWVARTRGPKLVVASQTRIIEAAIDAGGTWVPSVPAVAVVPHDPGELWRLAAALLAPAATAWLARRAAGTALTRPGLRVAGPDLAALPLPHDAAAWDVAAAALRGGDAGGGAFVEAASAAYGAPEIVGWWRARQSIRPGPTRRG